PSYVPANAPPLVLTGESYVKCGAPYARDLLGSNLLPLVEGDPVATKYARAARDYQLWALGADVASGLAGVAGFVVALRDDAGQNATAAQVLLNASIALAVLGPVLHVRASDRELDAVNAYNDRTAPARRRPPGAAGEGVPPPPCDERPAARAPGPPPPSPAGAP
ncbi:MAG TPA: hypothetical protein VFS43_27530, partial [Polyangiaceae bacterium]|nr:hypothetical protein [Polyangiaceae bacterium]